MYDSESATPTSYLYSIVSLLSNFYHAPFSKCWCFLANRTSCCDIHWEPLYGDFDDGIWKCNHGFLLVFHRKFSFIKHYFDIKRCKPEMTSSLFLHLGHCTRFHWRILNGQPQLPICVQKQLHLLHAPFSRYWCFLANRNWRHGAVSAKGRCTQL